MLNRAIMLFQQWRRWISRSEWLIRLLHLTKTEGAACEPGLILIQVDGLSRRQMERAMARGRLPFLERLLRRHKYRVHSLYSGLPSSTPAMTAELLYGVKTAVPAFSFYDRARESIIRMFEPSVAKDMDERLQGQGPPLLAGGSAYAGLYTGGAAETHFCASTMGLDDLFRAKYPLRLFIILLFSVYSLLRVAVLMAIEFVLAFVDVVRGLIAGQDLWREIKFIPSRVGVSILMRELATLGAMIDATRGLPIIFLDFVGYDEQSHRRGPTSRFAHWSLKGIDDAIGRIWRTARRSSQREYDIWIYSDHGSEAAVPYPIKHDRTLQDAIAELFRGLGESVVGDHDVLGIQSRRMRSYMLHKPSHHLPAKIHRELSPHGDWGRPVIAAMGPVGHLYLDRPPEAAQRAHLARLLVEQTQIPMVAACDGYDRALVWTKQGQFVLPKDAALVFAPDHPFLKEMTEDFIALCRHQNAGDFVLLGWSRDEPPVTFPMENGAHAGPGLEETHAFALLPEDTPLPDRAKSHMRPLDLRNAAMEHVGRSERRWTVIPPAAACEGMLRVMTYNAHTCVGIDGKLSPRRIARVISRFNPDVVALQELDVGRSRTKQADQARIIAECLNMDYHFHPAIQIEEEAYGDCVLSRLPMRLVRSGTLPSLQDGGRREPRGALWVAVELGGRTVHVVNTHLGLNARERLTQIQALLGDSWLGGIDLAEPVILCGDFNASPRSPVWKLCSQKYRDVQTSLARHSPRSTWFSHYPFVRIDHVFVSSPLRVVHVDVGSDYLSRVASDHRPLLAELSL
ncbi:MAG: endonuclease/exonuclease/phosphatase family protein [Phycisphaerales bacterium]